MTLDRLRRLEAIFDEALRVPDERRAAFLADTCGEDGSLLADIRRLLAAAPTATSYVSEIVGQCLAAWEQDQAVGELRPGSRLGRFEILDEIGRGGFGIVYRARDTELGRHVAVKVMRIALLPGASHGAMLVDLFRSEAEAAARLNHPNVVTIHDTGTHAGLPYLVLELLRGETLHDRLSRGPLTPLAAVEILIQVVRGLAHAHAAGVVHRDLKPRNVFLRDDGEVKILDLGLARAFQALETGEPAPASSTLPCAGTPAYMAPEQWRGEPEDERTDLFTAGVLLFEMLSGALPFSASGDGSHFDAAPPLSARLADTVPGELAAITLRAIARDPDARFQRAEDLLGALREVQRSLESPGVGAEPYRYLEPFTEADRAWFFGRDRETARLEQMLATRPLLALVGPSGAGKSSLVEAGLFPRLRRAPHFWTTLSLRPGSDPLRTLHARLPPSLLPDGPEVLLEKPGLFGDALRALAGESQSRVLLCVDQMEELVTLNEDAEVRRAFVQALLSAADDPASPTRVLVAIRDDFLSRIAQGTELRHALGQGLLLLGAPDAEALALCLREPAARLGFDFEPGLAEEMIAALGEETAPFPLLQLAASRLWERRDSTRRCLSRTALVAVGGVHGVLAAQANEVLRVLGGPAETRIARRILCDLVTAEGTRRQMSRVELVERAGQPDAAAAVLERLIAGRLLTGSTDPEGERVELAHEALIESWDQLRRWIAENREDRVFAERVSHAAAHWDERGRPKHLLWSEEVLAEALRWRRRGEGGLGRVESDFLTAAEAIAERARRRRRRWVVGGFIAALGGVLGLTFGIWRAREAARAARTLSVLRSAEAAADPHLAAQLLLEIAGEAEPAGAATLAYRLLEEPQPLAVLRGHGGPLLCVAFDPSGKRIATSSTDGSVRVWSADGGSAPLILRGHTQFVNRVAFSPDGTRMLSASSDGSARIWSSDGSGEPRVLAGHPGPLAVAVFSADGKQVATGGNDGAVRVWSDGPKPTILGQVASTVNALAFSPDGRRLVAAYDEPIVRIWRVDGGAEPILLKGHAGMVMHAEFAPGGERVATASEDGTARIWSADGKGEPIVLRGHSSTVRIATFDARGERLLTASNDGTARIWRIDGREEPIVLRGHTAPIRHAEFDREGSRVVTASHDRTARVWRSDGSGASIVLRGHESVLWMARFSSDGARVVTASDDRTARVWRAAEPESDFVFHAGDHLFRANVDPTGTRLFAFYTNDTGRMSTTRGRSWSMRANTGAIFRARFNSDGTQIVTTSADGTARIRPSDGVGETIVLRGHAGAVLKAEFSPDGSRVATVAQDRTARVWRSDGTGTPLILEHDAPLTLLLRFNRAGTAILTATTDGTARVWHLQAPGPIVLRGHEKPITDLDFSPDGSRVVTASWDGTARVWSLDGRAPVVLRGHGGVVWAASFDPSGERVVTGSMDRTVRIWRADGSGEPVVLAGHTGGVFAAFFSGGGSRVVSGSRDRTARIWSADGSGQPIALGGHESLLRQIEPWRDGFHVLTSSSDGTIRIRPLRTWHDLVDKLRRSTPGCLTPDQRRIYLGESPADSDLASRACEQSHAAR
jgi:WD40 repeat protein